MALNECEETFEVALTEKGVKTVNNKMSVDILQLLTKNNMSLAELSKETNTPPSSLYFQMDKLIDNGLVEKIRTGSSKKTTQYTISSKRLIKSTNASNMLEISASNFIKHMDEGEPDGPMHMAWILSAYAATVGLDIYPIMSEYGELVAEVYADKVNDDKIEKVMSNIKKFLMEADGTQVDVFSYMPLTIMLKPQQSAFSDKIFTFAPYIGFIKSVLSNSMKTDYEMTSVEMYDNTNVLKVGFGIKKKTDNFKTSDVIARINPEDDDMRFCICETTDGPIAIDSETQVLLMTALEERPLCIVDMLSKLDVPRSTIASNLARLEEVKVVEPLIADDGTTYYSLCCNVLLKRLRTVSEYPEWEDKIKSLVREDCSNYYTGAIVYLTYALSRLGFDPGTLMRNLGSRIADIMIKERGVIDYKELTIIGKQLRARCGVHATIVRLVPLTIKIVKESDLEEYSRASIMFYRGLITKLMTGIDMYSYGKCMKMRINPGSVTLFEAMYIIYPQLKPADDPDKDAKNLIPL